MLKRHCVAEAPCWALIVGNEGELRRSCDAGALVSRAPAFQRDYSRISPLDEGHLRSQE